MVLPIVSMLPFLNKNMDQKFSVLYKGPNFTEPQGYNTVKQARDDGALVLAYGFVYFFSSSFQAKGR
jgi:large conductance mechanosensitive channel